MLSIAQQVKHAASPYLHGHIEHDICSQIRVILADGRMVIPSMATVLDAGAFEHPTGSYVFDVLAEFAKNPNCKRFDGRPAYAEPYQIAALSARQKFTLFAAGIGSGKTILQGYNLSIAALCHPGGLSLYGGPSNKTLWLNTVPMVIDGRIRQVPKFEAYLPRWAIRIPNHPYKNGIYGSRNEFGFYQIDWINGHRTYVLSLEERSGAHLRTQGPDICYVGLDEASTMGDDVVPVVGERLRGPSCIGLRMFLTTSRDEIGPLEAMFDRERMDPSLFCLIEADTEKDASFQPPSYTEGLKALLSEKMYRRKVKAEVVSFQGLVYGDDLPCAPTAPCWFDYTFDPSRPVWIGLDFGYRRGAMVFGQEFEINGFLSDVIYDQIITSDQGPEAMGELLRLRLRADGNPGGIMVAAVHTDYSTTSETDRKTFKRLVPGLMVRPAVSEQKSKYWKIPQGIELVRQRCRDARGVRRLYLARSIRDTDYGYEVFPLLRALGDYKYPDAKPGRGLSEYPIKNGNEHILDALRYYVLGRHMPKGSFAVGDSDGKTDEGTTRTAGGYRGGGVHRPR